MNLLITAGGTSEKIDDVRSITNHSTGRLGKEIAEAFLRKGHTVTYLTTQYALQPEKQQNLAIVLIETTEDLSTAIEELTTGNTYDSIIHSMAVSDFSTETSLTEDELLDYLAKTTMAHLSELSTEKETAALLSQAFSDLASQKQESKKISSNTERLLLFLKKNPKIIAMFREKQPETILVGFKLLVGVSEEELIETARNTLVKNQCDFVFANDLEKISGQKHWGILLHADGSQESAETKTEIAQLILTNVEKRWREKK